MKYQKFEAVGRPTFFSDEDFLIKKKKKNLYTVKGFQKTIYPSIYPSYNNIFNSIGGVMSSVFTLSVVDHGSDRVKLKTKHALNSIIGGQTNKQYFIYSLHSFYKLCHC